MPNPTPAATPFNDLELKDPAMDAVRNDPAGPARRGQPPGLYLLFTFEMWERFSFYGMRAILVLYLTAAIVNGGLGWDKESAGWLMGWYGGLVYLSPVLGGIIADRFLGTHRCLVIGGWVIAAGHIVLAVESTWTLYVGLSLLIIGTGLFKSNVSTMVGQLYTEGDRRRDVAFTIFYMGINLGAFLGQVVCPQLQVTAGWRPAFGAAAVGMIIGQITYGLLRNRYLRGIGEVAPALTARNGAEATPMSSEETHRVWAILIYCFFVIFFWLAFEQSSTSMTFFANERVVRETPAFLAPLIGDTLSAGTFQSLNPMFILMLAPLFALLWSWMGRRGIEPSTPLKFSIGLFLLSFGFVFMILAAMRSEAGGQVNLVSPWWLVAAYFFHTCGELCLSPIGLSMITKLAPAKLASMLMGVWFGASFVSHLVGGALGGKVERIAETGFLGMPGQAGFFLIFVLAPAIAGLVMLGLIPLIKRLSHGRG